MLDANSLSSYEVVCERQDDDLPCCQCDEYRDIIVVKIRERTYDVCANCATTLGIKW
jgi:hypothetical protein